MTSVVEAKREYYKSLGLDQTSVADLETAYYEGAAAGTVPAAPLATTTTPGLVEQANALPPAPVPFPDLTAAAQAFNTLRQNLINAGIISPV